MVKRQGEVCEAASGSMALVSPLDPRLRLLVNRLSPDQRYEWEERAAIIEYDGGVHRWVAEREAWNQLFGHASRIEGDDVGGKAVSGG